MGQSFIDCNVISDQAGTKFIQLQFRDAEGGILIQIVLPVEVAQMLYTNMSDQVRRAKSGIIIPGNGSLTGTGG